MRRSADEARVRSGAAVRPAPAGAAADRFALQRTAGNRAVLAAVQRQDDDAGTGVTPAQTLAEIAKRHPGVRAAAHAAASAAFRSGAKAEVGGIVYQQGSKFGTTGPRTSGDGLAVDVGQTEKNAGAPDGAMPVGYWHTHPRETDPLTGAPRVERKGRAAFSDGDLVVAKDYQLDPFVIDKFGFHEVEAGDWYDPSVFTAWRPFKG
jgi:hypothetical protein